MANATAFPSAVSTVKIPEFLVQETSGVSFSYILLELTSLDEASTSIFSTKNKLTSLDVSERYVAVGSSEGKIYLFSRLTSSHVRRLSPVPVQVISANVGPVFKLAISPNEKYLAVASKKGPLAVFCVCPIGSSTSALASCLCHCSTEVNFVTALCWSMDSRKLYAGDLKGYISCTFVEGRNFVRSLSEVIMETDSEVVQIDTLNHFLLISTLTRCCLYDLDTLNCVQIGKKPRYGHFGSVFFESVSVLNRYSNGSLTKRRKDDKNGVFHIFACRPNGRLWESNKFGVVHRTHQYRTLLQLANFPLVSYRKEFLSETVNNNGILSFTHIHRVECELKSFLLLKSASRFCVVDPLDGRLVLSCDVEAAFDEYAVNGPHIIILSTETGIMREFIISSVEKAIEKLCFRNCFVQAANVIVLLAPRLENAIYLPWSRTFLLNIIESIKKSRAFRQNEAKQCTFVNILRHILDLASNRPPAIYSAQSGHHFLVSKSDGASAPPFDMMPSIVQLHDNKTSKSDFANRTSWRRRSRSAPELRRTTLIHHGSVTKRRSYSLSQCNLESSLSVFFQTSNDRYTKRKKLLRKAVDMLNNVSMDHNRRLLGSTESLKTILTCDSATVTFDSPMMLVDVPRELSIAKRFLETISRDIQKNKKPVAEKLSTETERSPRQKVFGADSGVTVERLRSIKRNTNGARIAKVVKPSGRRTIYQVEETSSECSETEVFDAYGSLPSAFDDAGNVLAGTDAQQEKTATSCIKRNLLETFNNNEFSEKISGTTTPFETKNPVQSSGNCNSISKLPIACSYVVENFVVGKKLKVDCVEGTSIGPSLNRRSLSCDDPPEIPLVPITNKKLEPESITPSIPSCSSFGLATTQPSENSSLTGHCHSCGLHESWLVVMIFGPVMNQLKIVIDQFEKGGVPSGVHQWSEFFDGYLFSKPSSFSNKRLCDECAKYFEYGRHLENKKEYMIGSHIRRQKLNDETTRDQQYVRGYTLSLSEKAVYDLFFKRVEPSSEPGSMAIEIGHETETEVKDAKTNALNCVDKKRKWFLQHFSGLLTLQLSQLLNCMRLCEGIDAVFGFLLSHKLRNCLTQEDWQWLVVLKAYHLEKYKQNFPKQLVSSVLSDLGLDYVIDCGPDTAMGTSEVLQKTLSKSYSACVMFSADSNCPFCTLPLKTVVSDVDRYVTVFSCGHAYHKICLREASVTQCVRCELERRRLRKQLNASAARNMRQSSPSIRTSGARYFAAKTSQNVLGNRFNGPQTK